MAELSWNDAIVKVLTKFGKPMHYVSIAEAIAKEKLKTTFGATPANSVNTIISVSLQKQGAESPFIRLGKGVYALKQLKDAKPTAPIAIDDEESETGLINAFGMYWKRELVVWKSTPEILGRQQEGSIPVDFCNQKGVYLLHDGRSVIYVGRATEQPIGVRLRQHIIDRLNGRWDRFSWFGVYPVAEDGKLKTDTDSVGDLTLETLIFTMEALLIEGLEPPQNRKRGDEFKAVEFIQAEDPEFEKIRKKELLESIKGKL